MDASGLKLLYVSQEYTTHDRRFLEAFARAGYRVSHLRLEQGAVEFERRALPAGVRSLPWPRSERRHWPSFDCLKRLRDIAALLQQVDPDAVLAGPIQSATFMVAATGYRPLVAMSWGSDVLVDADRTLWSQWVTRFALRRSAGVLGDCHAVRAKVHTLARHPDDRIVTFPWGIDLDDFRPGRSTLTLRAELGWGDKVVLISTRTWEPRYAIDVLIRAFAAAWRRSPDLRLLLVGNGSQELAIRRLIRGEGVEAVVHAPGRIPYEALADYFRASDVYVSSALSDGTSISLLEAMACGLPVVVTRGYGNLEWVVPGINGWLATPGDSVALAEALEQAATDAGRRDRFGKANAAVARDRADWNRNVPQLLELLEHVAGHAR